MRRLILISLLIGSPAFAQQQPSPAELRGAFTAIVAERDAAMNLLIQSEAKASVLAEQVATLQAKVKELEAKQPKGD
jgi:hypothetical protein